MSVLIHALALHTQAIRALPLAGGVPNPAPQAPPGLASKVSTLLGWWKWGSFIAGLFGLIACGAMMAVGRRNRSSMSADGAAGIPWVLAGLTVIALACAGSTPRSPARTATSPKPSSSTPAPSSSPAPSPSLNYCRPKTATAADTAWSATAAPAT
jgi:hypothetical protein